MIRQRRISSTHVANPSNIADYSSNSQREKAHGGRRQIWQLPYFCPLNPDDEFEIHDLELVHDNQKKRTDILVRARAHSLARPTYKIQKQTHSHFLGKKNFDIVISRLDNWDSIQCKPIQSQSSRFGNGYITLFQAKDQSSRHISLTPTKSMVLSNTARGGDICLTTYCGLYDPQRSRGLQPRTGFGYHYLPLHTTDFEQPLATSGLHISNSIPVALTKPYSGGGYLVFDAYSRGRSDVLSTLFCTGYERRHTPRTGDIVLAELRLSRPVTGNEENMPSWRRLFRERHVSLFMSKRGIEAVFTGLHVNMFVPNSVETNRYTLTSGQAQEIIISLFATSLLAIQHEGIESKKWAWLLKRKMLETEWVGNGDTMHGCPMRGLEHVSHPLTQEKYPHTVGQEKTQDNDSASFTDLDHRNRARTPDSDFDKWKVLTYHASTEESVLRDINANDDSVGPCDTNAVISQETRARDRLLLHRTTMIHYPQEQSSEFTETPEHMEETENFTVTDPVLPLELSTIWPKEGPKVTGKPKPGVEGGIFW